MFIVFMNNAIFHHISYLAGSFTTYHTWPAVRSPEIAGDRTAWRSRVRSGVDDFEERRIKQKEERRQKRKECQNPAPQPDPAHSFPCPQCNRLFRARIGLISHLRTHPHTSEVMVISEGGGRTSSSSISLDVSLCLSWMAI